MTEIKATTPEQGRKIALKRLKPAKKEDIYHGLMIKNAQNIFFYVKILISQIGKEKTKQVLEQAKYDQGYKMGKEAAKKGFPKNIAGFGEAMASFSRGSDTKLPWVTHSDIMESTENRVYRRTPFCYIAHALLTVGADDPETFEVAKWFDNNDKAVAEGFHPGLKFERTKWLLDGDPYCEFYLEDNAPPREKREETKEIDEATKEEYRKKALEKLDSISNEDLYDGLMISNFRNILSLARILISQVGKEKAIELVQKAQYEESYERGRKAAELGFPKTIAGFGEATMNLSKGTGIKLPWVNYSDNIEVTDNYVLRRCVFCYLADALLRAGAEDPEAIEVARWGLADDKARAYGFNPDMKFERSKWLLDGDPYCEFIAET